MFAQGLTILKWEYKLFAKGGYMSQHAMTAILLMLASSIYGWQIAKRLRGLWWLLRFDDQTFVESLGDSFPPGFVLGLVATAAGAAALVLMTLTSRTLEPTLYLTGGALLAAAIVRAIYDHFA